MSNTGIGKNAKVYYNLETTYSRLFGGSFIRYGAYLGDLEAINDNNPINFIQKKYSELRQGAKKRV